MDKFLNKIIQGDCLEVMKQMPDKSVDLVVTSPPYDELRDYNGYSFEFEKIAEQLLRIIKDGGVLVWVVGDSSVNGSESCTSFKQALYFRELGFNLHDTMIFNKNSNPLPESNRYFQTFEYMFIFSKGKPKTFNPIKDRKNINFGMSKAKSTIRQKDGNTTETKTTTVSEYGARKNVWTYDVGFMKTTPDQSAYAHPAMFPEKLAQDHIVTWSNEGDIVLDIFSGSGTTIKMAKINKRNFVGIEISSDYCKVAQERLDAMSQQLF